MFDYQRLTLYLLDFSNTVLPRSMYELE
jgi:hypothetical protein